MLTALSAHAVCVLGGMAMALAWLRRAGMRGPALLLYGVGLGPLLGLGTVSLVVFYWRVAGWPAPDALQVVAVYVAIAAGLLVHRRHEPVAPPTPVTETSIWWTLGAVIAAAVSLYWLRSAFVTMVAAWPEGTPDAVAIWNFRARALFRDYWGFPASLAVVSPATLPHYPLLLPAAVAAQYFMLGGENPWVPVLTGLSATLSLGLLTFAGVRQEAGLAWGAAAFAFLFASAVLWTWGFGQVADVHVALGLLAASIGLHSLLPGTRVASWPPLLTGYCLGLLAWTKNEGLVLAGSATLAFVLTAVYGNESVRRIGRYMVLAACGASPAVVALLVFKRAWAPETGLDSFLQPDWAGHLFEVARLRPPIEAIGQRFVWWQADHGWGAAWAVLVAGLLLGWVLESRQSGRARPQVAGPFWSCLLASVAASWVLIYAATPYDQAWHIATSLDRLMLQVFPVMVVAAWLTLGSAASR